MSDNRHVLVLGGARSGKSRYAESRALEWPGEKIYLASAEALDDEMSQRIARHRAQRGAGWMTIEEPLDVVDTLKRETAQDRFVLFDCVTLWLTNLLLADRDIARHVDDLAWLLQTAPGRIVLVSNEVGQGIVPENRLSRRFRDEAGLANQAIAAAVSEVVLVAAGLPLVLKSP